MTHLNNSNIDHARKNLSRSASNSSLSSQEEPPVKKNKTDKTDKMEIEIQKSIFNLGDDRIHKAVVLDNQELFKKLQEKVIEKNLFF